MAETLNKIAGSADLRRSARWRRTRALGVTIALPIIAGREGPAGEFG
jgi:hypothetical protein